MEKQLGSIKPGTTVYILEQGKPVEYIVAGHNFYKEESTVLVRTKVLSDKIDFGDIYEDGPLDTYLNIEYKKRLDSKLQNFILSGFIPISENNFIERSIFILSLEELGMNDVGQPFPIFPIQPTTTKIVSWLRNKTYGIRLDTVEIVDSLLSSDFYYILPTLLMSNEVLAICKIDPKNSILISIKKLLGIEESYEHFDMDIIIHINSAFMILNQIGLGSDGFFIEDKKSQWSDFLGDSLKDLQSVKNYVYYRVRQTFDPPQMGYLVNTIKEQIEELEWRLLVQVERNKKEEVY